MSDDLKDPREAEVEGLRAEIRALADQLGATIAGKDMAIKAIVYQAGGYVRLRKETLDAMSEQELVIGLDGQTGLHVFRTVRKADPDNKH